MVETYPLLLFRLSPWVCSFRTTETSEPLVAALFRWCCCWAWLWLMGGPMMMGELILGLPLLSSVDSFTVGFANLPRHERNWPSWSTFFKLFVPKKLVFAFF